MIIQIYFCLLYSFIIKILKINFNIFSAFLLLFRLFQGTWTFQTEYLKETIYSVTYDVRIYFRNFPAGNSFIYRCFCRRFRLWRQPYPNSVFLLSILASISSLILAFSLLTGNLLTGLLTPSQTCHISFLVLLLLGIAKLFDRSCCDQADKADKDRDKLLSPVEAVSLGFALSIDSAAAGIGAALPPSCIPAAIAASFLWEFLPFFVVVFLVKSSPAMCRKISAGSVVHF